MDPLWPHSGPHETREPARMPSVSLHKPLHAVPWPGPLPVRHLGLRCGP
jgi:hypothetical protein